MINEEQLNELNLKGWIEFCSVNIDEHLINISKKIGEVISHPNGKLIDYLTPKEKIEAKKNTFSYNFEHQQFPLHTDTAFWNLPARFVLMSCEDTSETATTFVTYDEICKILTESELVNLKKSIFLIKTANKNFYTSLINKYENNTFLRFDRNCMKPVNKSAKIAFSILEEKLNEFNINKVLWDKPKIFIFDNWRVLHGRESIKNDKTRTLKRIYIKHK
ncbi:TauD/TfdA family dioxygenase [Chryseobacterium sp. LC2016-27]|uniref:TauD/TfdA family dioxygenase n=1 Tax=Chryseobacterium sp. LC2016-27 TaxID=2897326 RepID=UPI001E2E5C03|nr:TauD/TfdA family dioxygenase [Chryseobacterium sp. LC2016-27]MCD0456791.1 TauD/TfdA family dioxygenase [Chryseobacterium sp. LC2016-27]